MHRLTGEAELSAVATEAAYAEAGEDDATSDDEDSNEEREDFSKIAVAGEGLDPVHAGANQEVEQTMDAIHAIQGHLGGLRQIGCVRGVQALECELTKAKRKLRNITNDNESVRNDFTRLRRAEELRQAESHRAMAERKEAWLEAQRTMASTKAANKELQVKRQKL